jgi:hypothetical protein
MHYKIDTKEKFTVLSLLDPSLSSNLVDLTEFGEVMNLTPTESEAWDIVQMEEIERELLDSDDMEFSTQE